MSTAPPTAADSEKQLAAAAAVTYVREGMALGVGSGSTVACFIDHLAAAVRAHGWRLQLVAASRASEDRLRAAGLPLTVPTRGLRLDLTVDGADEIGPDLQLLKGGGGALLREKVLATAARSVLIIADAAKPVAQLGRFPLPLEVVPFALPWVLDAVAALGAEPVVRAAPDQPDGRARTDQGNLLVDCAFGRIDNPDALASRLQLIPGVVAHGLFLGLADAALVAEGPRVRLWRRGEAWADAVALDA